MEKDESSLNLEEDLQDLALHIDSSPDDNIFPQDLSSNNDINQKIQSLDSQNELNKAIIFQNSIEKLPTTSKKDIEIRKFLEDIEENQNEECKKYEENILLDNEEINYSGGVCGWCKDSKTSCILI